MLRSRMWQGIRIAALAAFLTVAFGSVAWCYDRDDYNRSGADRYGYQNGHRDGVEHGRYDRSEGYRYNIHSQQYNDAREGYERRMGPYDYYKKAYRSGYAEGYREAYSSFRRDDDRHWRDRDDWH
jgi:hypothetical protein